jgi:hypothetical protein
MGMGEPLLNYDATVAALRVLMDPDGFGVVPKRLTLSTVGILPALEKLMKEPVRPNLAISLHAPNATLRRELMPIEAKYPLPDVIEAAQRYPIPRGGAVTYEYVMLRGVNDQPAHARDLVRLLKGRRGKVNLIPLNPAREIPFGAPTPSSVDAFCRILADARIMVSVRRPRGQDILAACGQLHLQERAPAAVPPAVLSDALTTRALVVSAVLLVVCASVLLFPGLGSAPLERAEIYFLDGARSMVERADWLVPYYRGQPFFDKPPLTYWLMAASFRAFGFSAGAGRLVPAFATLGVLLATLWLGSVLFDPPDRARGDRRARQHRCVRRASGTWRCRTCCWRSGRRSRSRWPRTA